MSEREHTSGPWQSQHDFDRDGILTIIGNIDGPDEGRMHYTAVCEVADNKDGIANARLIAAAPDLLAALQAFLAEYVELVESGDAGFWDAEEEPKVIAARAAISKATGEP